jgi:hypothetical protein
MKTLVVLTLGALLIFGGCGRGPTEQEVEAILSSAKKEAEAILSSALKEAFTKAKEAEAILSSAKKEAEAISSSAKKEAVTKAKEAEYNYLKSKLTGLKRYENGASGWIEINKRYLSKFKLEYNNNKLGYVIYNQNDYGNVKPRFKLKFYDENGMSVAYAHVYWLFDSVEPGLKRAEFESTSDHVSNKIPKYYKLDFLE